MVFHGRLAEPGRTRQLMIDALDIASSALQAQQLNVQTIADNIANATTPGYTPQQAVMTATGQGGVSVAGIVAASQGSDNFSTQMVNLVVAQRAYEAALRVVGASNAMMHSLLATL